MLDIDMAIVEDLIFRVQSRVEGWKNSVLAGCVWTVGAMSLPVIFMPLVGNYCPSLAGPLCASLIIGPSSVVALYAFDFLKSIEQDTLAKVVALAIILFMTIFCTPLAAKLFFDYQICYLASSFYALMGVLAFFYATNDQ